MVPGSDPNTHGSGRTYKIKLTSGRILGPLKLDRVAALISKNRLTGTEAAREYPSGEWVLINQIPEIAKLFVRQLEKRLPGKKSEAHKDEKDKTAHESLENVHNLLDSSPPQLSTPTLIIPQGPTLVLPDIDMDPPLDPPPLPPEMEKGAERVDPPDIPASRPPDILEAAPSDDSTEYKDSGEEPKANAANGGFTDASPSTLFARTADQSGSAIQFEEHGQKNNRDGAEKRTPSNLSPISAPATISSSSAEKKESDPDATQVKDLSPSPEENPDFQGEEIRDANQLTAFFKRSKESRKSSVSDFEFRPSNIGAAETIIFQHKAKKETKKKKKNPLVEFIKVLVFSWALGSLGYDTFLADQGKPKIIKFEIIRPTLPAYVEGKSDASKSNEFYGQGMRYYIDDTIAGYRLAVDKLSQAVSQDVGNVKALAMLASSYLNLIDVSNKNDNYFNVISKLIDMSRAKSIDLPETVIADVEFFLVANRAEAAQNRVIEYTKAHQNKFGIEMFYYLGLTFFAREDAQSAAGYLAQFPDEKAFSAKIFYLRGDIAEKLEDTESALKEYTKAIKFNANHAKSYLKVAKIFNKQGRLKDSANYLEFLMNHTDLLAPKELGQAYYLHAQLSELFQKPKIAVGDLERAVKLDPDNHDILLEYYTILGKDGKDATDVKSLARMYYFMSEGEKLIQQGHYQEALTPLLQARQADDKSPLPLVKIGDMFSYLHDVENSKINYKLASDRAPTDIQVWSKYIQSLIQSYEWEDAAKAMDKFRQLPVNLSTIDKAAADIYQKQGQPIEAQTYYKKAMARETIDSSVYVAYAKSLMSVKNFKDPPFFFAIALRYDPLNVDAIINTAKCLAETESIDRGISMLQDEMKHANSAQAELLTGVAELQKQKGDWDGAQKTVDQAMQVDPQFAGPWKVQAEIFMNRENTDKTALDNALLAYRSFSDRNGSDPSGYLERYKIFVKKADFEKAKDELGKIFVIYPKYPNLHYYLGILYGVQGNHRAAAEELKQELTNNPTSFQSILAYGKELSELEDPKAALQYFTKAMAINGSSADAKQSAGWANYQLKNFQAAFALLTEASQLDTANPIIYKRMGIVRRDMGDLPGACTAFRKYLEMEPDATDKADFKACL